jgi:hypothetical protein
LPSKTTKNKWKKQLHTWHWVSSAVSLICMILFSVTGITLNHASSLESEPSEIKYEKQIPQPILNVIKQQSEKEHQLPSAFVQWATQNAIDDDLLSLAPERNEYEIYIQKPIPGGDKWMSVDLESGEFIYMHTDRGWIAWLNDLHKGRNTHISWIWFIDIFAIATLVFCITGLILLQIHSKRRPLTWYITSAGVILPGIIAFFYL